MHAATHGTAEENRKAWGIQRPILRNSPLHVDEIEIVPGGYCSVHYHKAKDNVFHVLRGKLAVFCFNDSGAIIRTESLDCGEYCVIEAGVWHQFWSKGGCLAQEVYWGVEDALGVVHADIVRKAGLEEGGIAPLLHGVPSMAGIYLSEAGS